MLLRLPPQAVLLHAGHRQAFPLQRACWDPQGGQGSGGGSGEGGCPRGSNGGAAVAAQQQGHPRLQVWLLPPSFSCPPLHPQLHAFEDSQPAAIPYLNCCRAPLKVQDCTEKIDMRCQQPSAFLNFDLHLAISSNRNCSAFGDMLQSPLRCCSDLLVALKKVHFGCRE